MRRIALILIISLSALATCAPRIAWYSPAAYATAVDLKVETRALALKAAEPYAGHAAAVDALLLKLEKAFEYARGIPDNQLAARQWEIIRAPQGELAGGFFRQWKEQGALDPAFVAEKARQIDLAFDQIIGLEGSKDRRTREE
ncbi:MAG: hypothetical protein MUF78_11760 [Candidatus Edwardsbacteria bacterium]|nr:hypothetical protein [Candidatus Edwardsbacteria bacterium]